MKAHLQLRPCCREAQCGTGKAAYRIATSFQSAGYNTNVACLAPALVPRAMLKAYSVSPGTHFLHCGITHPWPSRLQMRNSLPLFLILAMFPLFPLLYQNWTVLKRQHASSHTSKRLGSKCHHGKKQGDPSESMEKVLYRWWSVGEISDRAESLNVVVQADFKRTGLAMLYLFSRLQMAVITVIRYMNFTGSAEGFTHLKCLVEWKYPVSGIKMRSRHRRWLRTVKSLQKLVPEVRSRPEIFEGWCNTFSLPQALYLGSQNTLHSSVN